MKREQGYKDENGTLYPHIVNVKTDDLYNLGTFVAETDIEKMGMFKDSDTTNTDGVLIYKTNYDKNKAIRLYKDYGQFLMAKKYGFINPVHHDDYKHIEKLQERQERVLLTEFPTGVLTIDNIVLGQEVPYYENYKPLDLYDDKRCTYYYLECIKRLIELYNNGIIYVDVHNNNFILDATNTLIKIIDFEKSFISFDCDEKSSKYKGMLSNLKNMILNINENHNIDSKYDVNIKDSVFLSNTLEEMQEKLIDIDYKLLKRM